MSDKRQTVVDVVYDGIKQSLANKDCAITKDIEEEFKNIGDVSIEGKRIMFNSADEFIKASNFSSNFEIYPKTDGNLVATFTFHNLDKDN